MYINVITPQADRRDIKKYRAGILESPVAGEVLVKSIGVAIVEEVAIIDVVSIAEVGSIAVVSGSGPSGRGEIEASLSDTSKGDD